MPTNRKRVLRGRRHGPLASWKTRFLLTGEIDETDPEVNSFTAIDWTHEAGANTRQAFALWSELQGDLMAYWIAKHPGSRPFGWWAYEITVMRLRVGGMNAELPLFQRFAFGLPTSWLRSAYQVSPPLFESQATFLDRHGLLTSEECARIEPAAFDPVRLELTPDQLVNDTFTRSALHEYARQLG